MLAKQILSSRKEFGSANANQAHKNKAKKEKASKNQGQWNGS